MNAEKPAPEGGWALLGFGGYGPQGYFERMIGRATARKNGSFLDLYVRLPGTGKTIRLSLLQDELREMLEPTKGVPFGGHGEQREVRVEVDVPPNVAWAQAIAHTSHHPPHQETD